MGREEPAWNGESNQALLRGVSSPSSLSLISRGQEVPQHGEQQVFIYHLMCYQPRAEPGWWTNMVTPPMVTFPTDSEGSAPKTGTFPHPILLAQTLCGPRKESELTFQNKKKESALFPINIKMQAPFTSSTGMLSKYEVTIGTVQ